MLMVLSLLYLLAILIVVNFVIGCLRGIWNEGFKKDKFFKGLITYALILLGFAAIDLFAYAAGQKIQGFVYLAGILLDPIARYFVKLLDTLRELLDYVFGKKSSESREPAAAEPAIAEAVEAEPEKAAVIAESVVSLSSIKTEDVEMPPKRKRGRPRKHPLPEDKQTNK